MALLSILPFYVNIFIYITQNHTKTFGKLLESQHTLLTVVVTGYTLKEFSK